MRVGAALAAGGLILLAALLAVLLSSADSRSGSNGLTPQAFVAEVGPGRELCQREAVPAPTGSIRMTIGTFGRTEPELVTSVRVGERVLARGVLRAGWQEGVVELPLPVARRLPPAVRLCVANPGSGPIALGGERVAPFARVGGARQPGRAAVVFLRPGERTWAQAAGDVVRRSGFGRADLFGGGWAVWVALALVVASAGVGVRLLLVGGRVGP